MLESCRVVNTGLKVLRAVGKPFEQRGSILSDDPKYRISNIYVRQPLRKFPRRLACHAAPPAQAYPCRLRFCAHCG